MAEIFLIFMHQLIKKRELNDNILPPSRIWKYNHGQAEMEILLTL